MIDETDAPPPDDPGDFVVTGTPAKDAPPVEAPPPVQAAAPDPAADREAPPTPPEAREAGKQLAKGDPKAGRTLSDRARTIQAEIHALTAQKHTSKQEAEEARRELEALRAEKAALQTRPAAPPAARPAPASEAATPKPLLKDFDTYEAYDEANAQWLGADAERRALAVMEQRFAQERERAEAWQSEQAQRQQQAQLLTQHEARLVATRAAHADFDTVLSEQADLPTNPMMDTHILHSEVGGELMHYLATHPEECERIASLPPGPTLVALGKIEARMEPVKSGPAHPPPISQARPPIKPVGSSSGTVDDMPDESASLDAHVAYWNRKDREHARR